MDTETKKEFMTIDRGLEKSNLVYRYEFDALVAREYVEKKLNIKSGT